MNTIFHDEKDINIDMLSDSNLVLIKYKYHITNNEGQVSYIKSCTPGNFYLAYKEKTQTDVDTYRLITMNDYERKNNAYVRLKKDKRFEEYKIDGSNRK